jgi:hypothetical protein
MLPGSHWLVKTVIIDLTAGSTTPNNVRPKPSRALRTSGDPKLMPERRFPAAVVCERRTLRSCYELVPQDLLFHCSDFW